MPALPLAPPLDALAATLLLPTAEGATGWATGTSEAVGASGAMGAGAATMAGMGRAAEGAAWAGMGSGRAAACS